MRGSRGEVVLRWGFVAALVATFVLVAAYLVGETGYPRDNFKAFPSWNLMQTEVQTAEILALLSTFLLLAVTWYARARSRTAFPIAPSHLGLAAVLAGIASGAAGHLAFAYLLAEGRFPALGDPGRLGIDALLILAFPLVALGLGLLTFRPAPPAGAPSEVPGAAGRNP